MHTTPIKPDPGLNQPLILRRKRNATIEFRFWNDTAFTDPHTITDQFELNIKTHDRALQNLLQFKTSDGTLTISDNIIRFAITTTESDLDCLSFYWELYNATLGVNWFQSTKGKIITGDAPDGVTEVDGVINVGDNPVNVTMAVTESSGDIDGGAASTIYAADQIIDGGTA